MTSQANKDNSETAEIKLPRPGQRLHAARVAADLDLPKLAAQMHLSEETLHAVEIDEYDSLPTRVFARGYYRNYARLLGLPEDEIMEELDQAWPEEGEELTIRPVGSQIKPEVRSSHRLVRLVTWLIVLGSVALFGVWWVGYLQWHEQPPTAEVTTPQPAAPAPDKLLSLPPVKPAPAPVSVDIDQSALPEPESQPEAAGTPASEAVAEPEAPVLSEAPAVEESPAATAAVEEPAPVAVAKAKIVLSFHDSCWTDIRDSSGSFRLFGMMSAGTTRELAGEPPYKVLLGNSKAVDITIDGRPFDQSGYAKANVARFTLSPDNLPAAE